VRSVPQCARDTFSVPAGLTPLVCCEPHRSQMWKRQILLRCRVASGAAACCVGRIWPCCSLPVRTRERRSERTELLLLLLLLLLQWATGSWSDSAAAGGDVSSQLLLLPITMGRPAGRRVFV
jgi:hypothetical protein